MKYRAALFDLFGTLVENFSRTEYAAILKELAEILNAPIDEFRQLWSDSFHDRCTGAHGDQRDSFRYICNELGISVTDEQIDRAFNVRLDYTIRCLKPRDDTLGTIKKLREAGYKIALISDCSGEVPIAWPETAFAPLFDAMVYSCTAGTLKPDPVMYLTAAGELGVKPEECIYVGDGNNRELTGARRLGIRAFLIRDPDEDDDTHFIEREDDWDGDRIAYLRELLPALGISER